MTIDGAETRTSNDDPLEDVIAGASVAIAISSASLIEVTQNSQHGWSSERGRPRFVSSSLYLYTYVYVYIYYVIRLRCTHPFQAAFMGIPTISLDYVAAVYRISCHSFDDLRSVVFEGTACRPPRAQWLYDLAYTMWNKDDVRNGNVFRYLFRAGEQHWGTFAEQPFRLEDSEYIN